MAVIGTDRQTTPDQQTVKRTRKRPVWRRNWVWLALVMLLTAAATGGWFWWQARQSVEAAQATYTTVSVTPAAYDLTISGPGTLTAAENVSVSTPVAGTIQSLANVGDTVEKGQMLAQLETDTLQASVTETQLALQQAQTQLESLRLGQTDSSTSLTGSIAEAERSVTAAQRRKRPAGTCARRAA